MSDLTILVATGGAKLAKTIKWTDHGWEKRAFDNARLFDVESFDVTDIESLSAVLTLIEEFAQACVIRGRRIAGRSPQNVRRLLHPTQDSPAVFEERASPWLMMDIDDLPAPPDLTNAQRLEYIVDHLPPAFQGADFHYQWSASAGLTDSTMLRAHLFFWLSTPIRCSRLRAQAEDQEWMCDLSLFNPVQIHYTAKPIFQDGPDPLAGARSGLVRGDRREVTLPPWTPTAPSYGPTGAIQYHGSKTFEDRLAAIGPDYHLPILKAAASYAAIHGFETDPGTLKSILRDVIAGAPPGRNSKNMYLCERYLDRVIDGARKFSAGSRQRSQIVGF